VGALFANAGALDLNGLPPLVITADGAHMVRPAHCPALRAARKPRQLESEMTASFALTRFGIAFFWQWRHGLFLPFGTRRAQAGQSGPASIDGILTAVAVAGIQVTAAVRAEPSTVRPAQRLHGSRRFSILPDCLG